MIFLYSSAVFTRMWSRYLLISLNLNSSLLLTVRRSFDSSVTSSMPFSIIGGGLVGLGKSELCGSSAGSKGNELKRLLVKVFGASGGEEQNFLFLLLLLLGDNTLCHGGGAGG